MQKKENIYFRPNQRLNAPGIRRQLLRGGPALTHRATT